MSNKKEILWKELDEKYPKSYKKLERYITAYYSGISFTDTALHDLFVFKCLTDFFEKIVGIICTPIPLKNEFPKCFFLLQSKESQKLYTDEICDDREDAEIKMFLKAFSFSETYFTKLEEWEKSKK